MAIDAVLAWSAKQAQWQQDALRRVTVSGDLSDADSSSVLANLKQAQGIAQKEKRVCEPLTQDHLHPDAQKAPLALLCSIGPVRNVNRLATDQRLPFGIDGITIVYGENGSGKSGYCRIAKKLCRAKVVDTLHPNVFEEGKAAPAEAVIRYKVDGKEDVVEDKWYDGQPGPTDIAHISVFDSHNARLYVDEKNRIEYLPYEIELLTRFGQLLVSIQETFAGEIGEVDARLKIKLPTGYTPDTKISELVEKLDTKTALKDLPSIKEIEELGVWPPELAAELAKLEQEVGRDPKVLADQCRRVHDILNTLGSEFTAVKDGLSKAKADELEKAVNLARTTAEAAALSATETFKDDPLEQVGSDAWRLMFEHAKKYSLQAYPDVKPPATRDGDLCVLCQQPLNEEAADRLGRFEEYVAGQARKEAEGAALVRDKRLAGLRDLNIRSVDDAGKLFSEYCQMSDARAAIAADAITFLQVALTRRDALIQAGETGKFEGVEDLDSAVIDRLKTDRDALNGEAGTLEKAVGDEKGRKAHQSRLAELKDRKRLSEELDTVRARRNDLELRAKLQACRNAAGTNAVSHQVSALRKELITQDLNDRMLAEIEELDLTHIPLDINDESRKGESHFEVTLKTTAKVSSRDILSEGEQRALGLSCFLADVNGQPVKHGVIIDDPVSSLDHLRIRKVAQRLVKEAANGRQVIVFTHNLVFFSDVLNIAAAHQPGPVKVLTHVVRKSEDKGFGVVYEDDEPWEGKPVNKRIMLLRERVKEIEQVGKKDDETYRRAVKDFYTDLRESWERLVEEVLLSKVVERFGSDVKTQSLKGVVVQDEDYQTIFWAMKRASERSGHDMAGGKNLPLPEVADMQKDIEELDSYRDAIRKRSTSTRNQREALEKPPKAATA